ncbi:MAG: hypothetical protein HYW05_02870 [Candidatus Diapherotrites archaeon]|nr:hypothetical protein [Candidatus Diapherotrites archaeon]
MDKDVIIAVVLAALILVSLFQTIQLVGVSNRIASGTGTASLSSGSGGETIEEMNERMHGSSSSSGSTGSSSSGSAMVGGC